jgi:uncharacterized protein YjbI with pentapeptide repeats
MVNDEHVALLKQGVTAWNAWRAENPNIRPDLTGADLRNLNLNGAKLREPNLREATLSGANIVQADLSGADLSRTNCAQADLSGAILVQADLTETDLWKAELADADLRETKLERANLREANFYRANLVRTDLNNADLSGGHLTGANFQRANLTEAKLIGANLQSATLVGADLTHADLTGCRIYGLSAWGLTLKGAKQQNLVITHRNEPDITVDNIEVAQFVYLLLHNEKIRDVIDTIGKKGVLLLGRFTEGRIEILERLREKFRSLGFVPMVFNFDKPKTKDFTETVRLLANLSHFVIVDITNPRSTPLELQAAVPDYMVPFVPILEKGQDPFTMFVDLQNRYDWVLEPIIVYPSVDQRCWRTRLSGPPRRNSINSWRGGPSNFALRTSRSLFRAAIHLSVAGALALAGVGIGVLWFGF